MSNTEHRTSVRRSPNAAILERRVSGIVPTRRRPVHFAPILPPDVTTLVDHGGPVLTAVSVTTIFWGAHWTTPQGVAVRDHLNAFFEDILTSDYMDLLAEYSTPGHPIGNGRLAATFTIADSEPGTPQTPPATGRIVTDKQIQTQLLAMIQAGTVEAVTANTFYFVYLPPNVASTLGTLHSCTDFCGYHFDINGVVFYAVAPFPTCSGCGFGFGTSDALTIISSHELAEAVTDPKINTWFTDPIQPPPPDPPLPHEEIGDLCAGTAGVIDGYQVQLEWSNVQGACVLNAVAPWRHLGKLYAHALEADFDCSGLPNAARSVSLGDVDGDGFAEVVIPIAASHSGNNDFWVMKYDPPARLWNHLSPIPNHALQADLDCSSLPNGVRSVTLGDVDGDGFTEVVAQIDAAHSGGNDFWVMKFDPIKRGWTHLSPIAGHALQADLDCSGLPNAARSVTLGDVDGDGQVEVVVQIDAAHSGGNDFWVMKFNRDAWRWDHLSPIPGHALEADFDCSGLPNGARSVQIGDVDGDGQAEVVIQIDAALSGGNDFWVMKFNRDTRRWDHLSPIPVHSLQADLDCSGLPNAARSVSLGDVDGDGQVEVVVQIAAANSGGNDFWVMRFSRDTRQWSHLSPVPGHALQADLDCSGLPNGARSVHVGDVNNDGQAEVVVQIDAANSGGNDFWVMTFDRDQRTWNHLTPISGHPLEADMDASGLANAARAVALGDVDKDGRAEVVLQIDAAHSGGNDFWVMDLR